MIFGAMGPGSRKFMVLQGVWRDPRVEATYIGEGVFQGARLPGGTPELRPHTSGRVWGVFQGA